MVNMPKKHEKNTIDIENSKKLYYNTTEIMKKVLKIINSTRGALNERLRVRYSLDPFNLLDNASVGSVENIPVHTEHLPMAGAFFVSW